jgi:hypothetical protein
MTTKTFKTVASYLRSENELMESRIPRDASDEARIAAIKAGQRGIINRLLPQLALPMLDESETPLDGVKRLIADSGTEQQVKALKDCQRWLKNYLIVLRSSAYPAPRRGPYSSYQSGHVGGARSEESKSNT